MKNKIWFAANLFLLVLILLFTFNEKTSADKKEIWEYKTREGSLRNIVIRDGSEINLINSEAELTKFGNEGWELVVIEHMAGDSRGPIYIFKRKK